VARFYFKEKWLRAWLVMALTMAVDLDHLLADPVFNPDRCSIGFHPLHSYPALIAYCIFSFIPATRIAGTGLLLHMAVDFGDCLLMA
jgi:hypothetical protein